MRIDLPEVLAEIKREFARYEQALIVNDTATLNELFWLDDRVLRLGTAENLYGHAAIAGFRAARPAAAAQRRIGRVQITSYGCDCAHTCVEFERDGRAGRQTQTWLRLPEGWRIVAAHVSLLS